MSWPRWRCLEDHQGPLTSTSGPFAGRGTGTGRAPCPWLESAVAPAALERGFAGDTRPLRSPPGTCGALSFRRCEPTAHRSVRKVLLPPPHHRGEWLGAPPAAAWLDVG